MTLLPQHEITRLLDSLAGGDRATLDAIFPPLLGHADAGTLAIGQRIGPYTFVRAIGEGGMGVVDEALREDVDRHLAGLPVRARGDSLGFRARKFVQRHRAGLAAGALASYADGERLLAGLRERGRSSSGDDALLAQVRSALGDAGERR